MKQENVYLNKWVNNDGDNEYFKESIRDIICGDEPQMIFTNDSSSF